jgi:hypothetical protein
MIANFRVESDCNVRYLHFGELFSRKSLGLSNYPHLIHILHLKHLCFFQACQAVDSNARVDLRTFSTQTWKKFQTMPKSVQSKRGQTATLDQKTGISCRNLIDPLLLGTFYAQETFFHACAEIWYFVHACVGVFHVSAASWTLL